MGDIGKHPEQALNLGSHPAQTLFLKIFLVADLLVKNWDACLIMDVYLLHEQKGFQLSVFTGSTEFIYILPEPFEIKTHT